MLEDKYEEYKVSYNSLSEELKIAKNEMVSANVNKEQALTELESKLRVEHMGQIAIIEKGLENKIKILEQTKENLSKKNSEILEEIKQINKKHEVELVKFEKEINISKQEYTNLQKDNVIITAKHKELENEIAMLNGIIEVYIILI